jgi:hypothetical protein
MKEKGILLLTVLPTGVLVYYAGFVAALWFFLRLA